MFSGFSMGPLKGIRWDHQRGWNISLYIWENPRELLGDLPASHDWWPSYVFFVFDRKVWNGTLLPYNINITSWKTWHIFLRIPVKWDTTNQNDPEWARLRRNCFGNLEWDCQPTVWYRYGLVWNLGILGRNLMVYGWAYHHFPYENGNWSGHP